MKNSIRIIVSDDSQIARSGLIALLRSLRTNSSQFEVVGEASNGEEVIGMIEDLNPDVVFMDARMPVMDGIEATRIVKARIEGVKVIVISMYSEFQQQAYEAGADLFLKKGVNEANLDQIIRKLIEE